MNSLSIRLARVMMYMYIHVYTCIYLYVVNVMLFRLEPEIKKGFVDLIFSLYENLPREVVMRCNRMPCNAV